MGQYHGIYNKTKKEYFSYGGAKLWEKASNEISSMGLMVLLCNSNGRGGGDLNNPIHADDMIWKNDKLIKRKTPIYTRHINGVGSVKCTKAKYIEIENALQLISGRWAGDEIVIQGDYAEETDPAFIKEKEFSKYKDITKLVINAFELIYRDEPDEDTQKLLKGIEFERRFSRDRF